MERSNKDIVMRVSIVSIIGNVILSAFKLIAGIFANSGAMISDSVHSMSDILSTFIAMIGVHFSSKASDKDHQYGHERLECVTAIILASLLFATGIGIGYSGIMKIFSAQHSALAVPGVLALVAAIVSIIVKEAMYWYTVIPAKRINSGVLMADAWDHRADALSSIGSFVGILGARLGFPVLDPIASVVICLLIAKASYDIFMDAVSKMTDRSCDDETVERLRETISSQEGVIEIDTLKTRLFGDKIYVDVEIKADGSKTLKETHHTAQIIHDAVEKEFPAVKHCMVHVNPQD